MKSLLTGLLSLIIVLSWLSGVFIGVALGAEGEERWGQRTIKSRKTQECIKCPSDEKVPPKKKSLRVIVGLIVDDCDWKAQEWWDFNEKLRCVKRGIDTHIEGKTDEGYRDHEGEIQ